MSPESNKLNMKIESYLFNQIFARAKWHPILILSGGARELPSSPVDLFYIAKKS